MKTLYTKFIAFTVGIMSLSFILAFVFVNTFYHQQLKGKNDEKNVVIAENIASFIEASDDIDLDHYLATQANTGYKLFVVSESEAQLFFGEPFRVENLSESSISRVLNGQVYHGMRDLPKETFMTGFFSDEMANTVGVPFSHQDEQYALFLRPNIALLFTEVHYLMGGLFIGMAIISLLAMLVVAKMLITPITKLTAATKKVSKEQFLVDLPINRQDEIGQLAQSFRKMTNQLSENDRIRKEFISNVSHDFQTPLLNIKGYANLLMDENLTKKQRENHIKVIQLEVERLSSLTKQLLLLTSLGQLTSPVDIRTFQLNELLKETVYKYHWLLNEKNISLTMEADAMSYNGDPALLESAFENLLSNAIKYTEANGTIDIILKEVGNQVVISIKDSGIGIEKTDIPRLFDRFFRVDESRNEKIEGTGLGLSIVQQVVKLHNGTIRVESARNKGSTFSVTLPKL